MTSWSSLLFEAGALALDFACVVLLNKWINHLNSSALQVKNAKTVTIGPELLEELKNCDGQSIAYACVEGEVSPVSRVLRSHHGDHMEGVIQQISLAEHKSKRVQGYWSDVKNMLRETLDQVPFCLKAAWGSATSADGDGLEVHVLNPTEASYLLDNLTTTYDQFEPYHSGILQRGVDRLFGEVPKGLHETEKMLLSKTMLLGIGEIVLVGKKITLQAPRNGALYVLSQLSKKEVINKLETSTFWVKILKFLFGIFGTFLAVHLLSRLYNLYKDWCEDVRNQSELEALRERRNQPQDLTDGAEDDRTENMCVVCLTNQREVVLLECGHICLCGDCVRVLPSPRKCPICRQSVARYVSIYRP